MTFSDFLSTSTRFQMESLEDFGEVLKINISGTKFMIPARHLIGKESTRLGKLCQNGVVASGEQIFFRDPSFFPAIVGYYSTGKLHFHGNVCSSALKEELDFWQISETEIPPCCFGKYLGNQPDVKVLQAIKNLNALEDSEGMYPDGVKRKIFSFKQKWRRKLFLFIECPNSSKVAMVSCILGIFKYWTKWQDNFVLLWTRDTLYAQANTRAGKTKLSQKIKTKSCTLSPLII